MSEYWVSKKKYFCKYCDIFITDDTPSRQQHENGLRHKGNVERFVRGIYKTGEKHKKDLEEEKREMRRVEQAANAAFAQDVSAGFAKATSSPIASSSSNAPKKPIAKPSNPFTNYSTAQSLGYGDPDADRIAAQLELRRSQGVAGEWQIISPPQALVQTSSFSSEPTPPTAAAEEDNDNSLKREAEEVPPEEDSRSFKLRKKSLNPGLGEIYDPGLIPIKVKKEEAIKQVDSSLNGEDTPSAGEGSGEWSELKVEPGIKSEDDQSQMQPDTSNASTGSLFKKRKMPAGATKGRRQI